MLESPNVVSYKCGLNLGVSLTIYTFAWIYWTELAKKLTDRKSRTPS